MNKIENKNDRKKIWDNIVEKLEKAVEIAKTIEHPDNEPRWVERVASLADKAIEGSHTDPGLEDLIEYYFS